MDGKDSSCSVTSFVDDVSKKSIAKRHKMRDVDGVSWEAQDKLKVECLKRGVSVNVAKRVTQPWVKGGKAGEAMHKWYGRKQR